MRVMVEAGWLKRRHEVVARLVVLLHYDLPVKHPSPLPQHVEVELRKHCGDINRINQYFSNYCCYRQGKSTISN